jgi:hypothetical protein
MDIKTLIVARFLVEPGPSLLWRVTPQSLPILQELDIPINTNGEFAPPDEWVTARNLARFGSLISQNRIAFSTYLAKIIERAPNTLNRCTKSLNKDEYSLILGFAGQEVYDFFVHDHRFGPPPRGKRYRSNLRGAWTEKSGIYKISRPDNALLALRRSIVYYTALGADVSELEKEYARRGAAIAAGRSWREGMPGKARGGIIQDPNRPKGRPGRKPSARHLVFTSAAGTEAVVETGDTAAVESSPDSLETRDDKRI